MFLFEVHCMFPTFLPMCLDWRGGAGFWLGERIDFDFETFMKKKVVHLIAQSRGVNSFFGRDLGFPWRYELFCDTLHEDSCTVGCTGSQKKLLFARTNFISRIVLGFRRFTMVGQVQWLSATKASNIAAVCLQNGSIGKTICERTCCQFAHLIFCLFKGRFVFFRFLNGNTNGERHLRQERSDQHTRRCWHLWPGSMLPDTKFCHVLCRDWCRVSDWCDRKRSVCHHFATRPGAPSGQLSPAGFGCGGLSLSGPHMLCGHCHGPALHEKTGPVLGTFTLCGCVPQHAWLHLLHSRSVDDSAGGCQQMCGRPMAITRSLPMHVVLCDSAGCGCLALDSCVECTQVVHRSREWRWQSSAIHRTWETNKIRIWTVLLDHQCRDPDAHSDHRLRHVGATATSHAPQESAGRSRRWARVRCGREHHEGRAHHRRRVRRLSHPDPSPAPHPSFLQGRMVGIPLLPLRWEHIPRCIQFVGELLHLLRLAKRISQDAGSRVLQTIRARPPRVDCAIRRNSIQVSVDLSIRYWIFFHLFQHN